MTPNRTVERALLLASMACVASMAAVARADSPAPRGDATATHTEAPPPTSLDAAFASGLQSYEDKQYEEAIAKWEAIVHLLGEERAFKVLYNLGLAYQITGDATRSIERFEAFLRHLAAQPKELTRELEERRQDAAERVRAQKAVHGAVVLPAAAGHECAVRIDSAAARPAGFTAYLSPGEHTIELYSGSPAARSLKVQVTAGGTQTVDTAPPPSAPLAPSIVVVTAPEAPPQFPLPWVIAGATLSVASFGLPLALGLHAADVRAEAEALGAGHSRYAEVAGQFADARAAYQASYALPAVLGAATIAIAVIGLVRVRTYRPAERPPSTPAPSADRTAASASISIEPGGLWLRGAF